MSVSANTLAELAHALESALDAAERAHAALEDLLHEPRPQAADWSERIRSALAARDGRVAALGNAALAWRLAGGTFELVDPPQPTQTEAAPEPAPEPEPPPRSALIPIAPPATPAALRAFASGFQDRVGASAFRRDHGEETLRAILDEIGPAGDIDTPEAILEEIDGLRRALGGAEHRWGPIPRDAKRDLLALCACRARRLQTEGGLDQDAADEVERLLRKMTAYSASERPGYVDGLAYAHKPARGTWLADAQHWWAQLTFDLPSAAPAAPPNPERCLADLLAVVSAGAIDEERLRAAALTCLDAGLDPDEPRLIKLLLPHTDRLTGDRRLKPLRRAARAWAEAEEDGADEVAEAPWPFDAWTRGRSVVIVGGDRRDRTERRLEEAFGFAEVEWESGAHPRRLDAIASRISSGTVDFVILLTRFLSHKAYETLEAAYRPTSSTRRVLVDQGYGLRQIRAALERVLATEGAGRDPIRGHGGA